MSKITSFTWEQFWCTQEKYDDMMCEIEDRAIEISNSLGKCYNPSQLTDIYFNYDANKEYVVVEFRKDDECEDFEYFKFDSSWLFSDDYKKIVDEERLRKEREEAKEYQEYLRLKKKFEGD